jgi:hypothetical protein
MLDVPPPAIFTLSTSTPLSLQNFKRTISFSVLIFLTIQYNFNYFLKLRELATYNRQQKTVSVRNVKTN